MHGLGVGRASQEVSAGREGQAVDVGGSLQAASQLVQSETNLIIFYYSNLITLIIFIYFLNKSLNNKK